MSGLELAEKIIEVSCNTEIVFVTVHNQYALDAFKLNAIDYILKPLSFENVSKVIDRLKRIKPHQHSPQETADKGRIFCFEKFLVYGVGSETAIMWRTTKTEELFAFLVQNVNKTVSRVKITQALWPEYSEEKSIMYLHTTIYNLKKTLLSAEIDFGLIFVNGGYQLTLPYVYIDTVEFFALVNSALASSNSSIKGYESAYNLYKGRYLNENEYIWSQNKGDEYAALYHSLVAEMCKHYAGNDDYTSAESILQKALILEPIDDSLNEMLLYLYLQKQDKAAFVKHYNKIKTVYNDELGIDLNSRMRDLYYRASKL